MPGPIDYQGMIRQAQDSYKGIMAGYRNALSGQQRAQQGINQGYNRLQANVLGGLAGQGQARSQEIADYYTAQSGAAMQGLTNRGLGNTTIANSVGRGLAYDQTKAQNALRESVAGQQAQYQTQLGLAGLGYRGQANQQNTALLGQNLGYQGDWQGRLLGAGLQGAGQQYGNQHQQGWGRSNSGGRNLSWDEKEQLAQQQENVNRHDERLDFNDAYKRYQDAQTIDLNAGMYRRPVQRQRQADPYEGYPSYGEWPGLDATLGENWSS